MEDDVDSPDEQPEVFRVRVMVENLPELINNKTLREIFAPYNARQCKCIYKNGSKGSAAITFHSIEDANRAINEVKNIEENAVIVRMATEEDSKFYSREKKVPSTNISRPKELNLEMEEFLKHEFCIIDFESSVIIKGAEVYPCEIGIAIFSLEKGEIRSFHRFIDPGEIPSSEVNQALWITNNVHGIPYEKFELAEQDYLKLWNEVCQFIGTSDFSNITLWSKGNLVEVQCLNWLASKTGHTDLHLELREIQELCIHLREVFGNTSMTSEQLNDYFKLEMLHTFSGNCEFHEQIACKKRFHCALFDVKAIGNAVVKMSDQCIGKSVEDGTNNWKGEPWSYDSVCNGNYYQGSWWGQNSKTEGSWDQPQEMNKE